ncbi:MAG: DUF4177 domain-containing protein [Shimia sp.]
MADFEYKVVPAPTRSAKSAKSKGLNGLGGLDGLKGIVKGAKTTEGRFAQTLEGLMNELGAEGWEYVRADTLPVEERQGLTQKVTTYQNMLVFRRAKTSEIVTFDVIGAEAAAPRLPDPGFDMAALGADEDAPQTAASDAPHFAPNVTPLHRDRLTGPRALEALEPEEPGNYDGPDLNPVLIARARRKDTKPSVAAE